MPQKEVVMSAVTYTTALSTTAYGFASSEWLMLAGLFFTAATFAVNSIYKHLHYKLAQKRERKK